MKASAVVSAAVAAALLGAIGGSAVAADGTVETLPQPEAYRVSSAAYSRHILPASYVDRDVIVEDQDDLLLRRRYSSPSRIRSSRQEIDSEPSEALEDRLRRMLRNRQGIAANHRYHDAQEEYEAAASSYGGHGSESSHGLTCASGYVNASAVALLAFLFLLNIVQDVITQITGRRKRDIPDDASSMFLQFVGDGGIGALYDDLPAVLLPLMVKLTDAEEPACIQQPLCETNRHLSESYGAVGRVIGGLVSNIAAKTYSGASAANFDAAVAAASQGRAGSCDKVKICPRGGHKVSWKQNDNETANNLNGIK